MTTRGTEKTWTCDGCHRAGPWRAGWHQIEGVESLCNVTEAGDPTVMVVCSRACEEPALLAAQACDAGESA